MAEIPTSTRLSEIKKEHGIGDDFISWLIFQQLVFEIERVGTDGSLYQSNTLEHGLVRGVIGEAQEALEELQKTGEYEISEHLKLELIDVLIFLGSVFLHAGMNGAEVIELAVAKLQKNRTKYATRNFEGRSIADAIKYSRDQWNRGAEILLGTTVEPSGGRVGEEPQEYDYFEGYAGSLT